MNHRGQRAMRHGPWKYLRVDGNDYLFNLQGDERERANLAPLAPERLAAMVQAWEAWEAPCRRSRPMPRSALGYS